MTREEVKALFVSWGIEEPSNEQITDYLNKIQQAVKGAEDKAARYKSEADKVKELTKQLDEMNNAKLTDEERSAKAVEEANKRVLELENTVKTMQLQKSLAEIGITGEDASALVGEDGSLNTEKLGEILTAREKNAVDVYKKQALESTPSPEGKKEEKKEPDAPYKEIVDRVAASKKTETEAVNIIDSYK
jgi:hypothetical protein